MPKPTIYPRAESGLGRANSYNFGLLGDPYAVTIHHSAGPRATSKARCQQLNRQYQLDHMAKTATIKGEEFTKLETELSLSFQPDDESLETARIERGWGDIGYHWCMDDFGRFYELRPIDAKGAHVGGWNTGNIGIMVHGNYENDELYVAQRESIEWLFKGGIAVLTGVSEHSLTYARSHQEWPGHESNACPGRNLQRHYAWRRSIDFK